MLDCRASASTRLSTTSGIVPGFSAAPSSSFSSWRAVTSSRSLRLARNALARFTITVAPDSVASALSAPVRSPVCSGVTSVAATQSASAAVADTGISSDVTTSRNASASFSVAVFLCAFGGAPDAALTWVTAATSRISLSTMCGRKRMAES